MTPRGPAPVDDDRTWYKDAVVYQLHVKAFADSDGDGIGDFGGLTERLDYLQELGVTAIWLLPFYPSPLRDDGYDIADYAGVNPSYGDLPAFKRFLREAHRRGLRVITELVINHTSDEHAWFQRARRAARGSSHRSFYVWSDSTRPYGDARVIFADFESSNWTWDPTAGQYYWHRFYSHQPDLNFENPAVHKAVFRVLDRWLAMGVDGVRLDAVPYLYEREGTNCENLPETHDFLKALRAHVDERFEQRMLLAEANQWPEDAVAYFGEDDECHMAFHFPVMPRLYMGLQMEDRHPIVDILEQTPSIPPDAQWAMFLRNHDELTLEMVTDEERDYMYRAYGHDPQMRINVGIRRRLAPLLQNDRRKIELLNVLLFSLPGTPVLYYGDEIGMGDNVYLGDRDGVRTPMQWSADRNAGFSRANPQRLYLPPIIDPEYHYETVNADAQRANPSSLWWWMRRLIALRKRHHVLGRGELTFLDPDNHKVLAFVRSPNRGEDGDVILCVANLSRNAQAAELDLSDYEGVTPVEMFGHTPFARVGQLPYYLTLAPYGYFWLRLDPRRAPTASERGSGAVPSITLAAGKHALDGAAEIALERALAQWMPRQRWFGGKSRVIRVVSVDDRVEVVDGRTTPGATVLVVTVNFDEGDPERYCIPVAVTDGVEAARQLEEASDSVIAHVRQSGGEPAGMLVDAVSATALGGALARVAGGRRVRRGRVGTIQGWSTARFQGVVSDAPVTPLRAEQSNTSVLLGDRAVLKLFRRLDEGVSPDLEIGRHLSSTGFEHVAGLLGSVEYTRGRADPTTIAVIHEFVPNEGDAWQYALDKLAGFYEDAMTRDEGPDPAMAPNDALEGTRDAPAAIYDLVGPFLSSAEFLGRRTAELHIALGAGADRAFAPEAFTALYQRSLYQSVSGEARRTLRVLRAQRPRWTDGSEALAALVGEIDADRCFARIDEIRRRRVVTDRIRVHGDFHLGQVLWDGRDFTIIDFEGEPSRSVGERRLKRSPLRDVAGLLRSLDYVTAVGLRAQVDRGAFDSLDDAAARLGAWADLWAGWVGSRYVTGYLDAAGGQPFVPSEPEDLRLLLDLFLLEKVCYEIRYELDRRPEWVEIPLRALARLIRGFPDAAGQAS